MPPHALLPRQRRPWNHSSRVSAIATRADIANWIEAYERAWRTAGTESLVGLFSPDATYLSSPYAEPARGLAEIAALWEREREGPGEPFEMSHEVVAVDGAAGVARVTVSYGRTGNEYRDLWVIELADDGRCREFEEWPFWPGQPLTGQGEDG